MLDHFDEISICTDYGEIDYETFDVKDIEFIKLPGWKTSTVGIKISRLTKKCQVLYRDN